MTDPLYPTHSLDSNDETPAVGSSRSKSERRRGEGAFVIVWVTMMMTVLLGIAGMVVDLGNWYLHIQVAQRAADSASLDGDPWLPQSPSIAYTVAAQSLSKNGFTSSPAATYQQVVNHPTQLQVTVHTSVNNVFLRFLGVSGSQGFTRTAIADHTLGLHLSTGKNLAGGHEPTDSTGIFWAPPPSATDGNYWMAIAGQGSAKVDGDRFSPTGCNHPGVVTPYGVDGCTGNINLDHTTANAQTQYNYHVHVAATGGPTRQLVIQSFDAGYAQTGVDCSDAALSAGLNYGSPPNVANYCAGDYDSLGAAGAPSTTYRLLDKVNGTVISTCKSYAGYSNASAAYASGVTWIHNWETVCNSITVDMNKDNDFVLNVSTDGGSGENEFLLRAGLFSNPQVAGVQGTPVGGLNVPQSQASVTFSADINEAIFNSNNGGTVFPLAHIPPDWAGKTVTFDFFDIGDSGGAIGPGAFMLTGEGPSGVPGNLSGCRYTPPPTSTGYVSDPNCAMPFLPGNQGQDVKFQWTVPASWSTCAASGYLRTNGCWIDATISYGLMPNDFTTWSLSEPDEPLRIIH